MAGSVGTIDIDTAALARPRPGAVAQARTMTKLIALALAGLLGAILWFFGVLWVAIKASDAASGVAEAGIALIGIAIGALPGIALLVFVMRFRSRHFAGVGSMMAAGDFNAAQLRQEVPGLGVTLETVIERVGGFARGLGPAPTPFAADPAKRAKSRTVRFGLVAALVGGLALYAITESLAALLPVLVAVAGFPIILMRARQAVQPTLDEVRAHDRRKPVLLLRSFQDDAIQMIHRFQTRVGEMRQPRRFEQQIAGMLEAFGPLVAIGKPGEELPQIGAARAYLSETEWQPAVIRLMDEALFIAMVAGATEWIRWELARIVEMGRLRQLLVLVPPMAGTGRWDMPYSGPTDERWANVLAGLDGTRWQPALRALDIRGLLLVRLRPDGDVIAIRRSGTASPFADDYQLAIAVALYDAFCRES